MEGFKIMCAIFFIVISLTAIKVFGDDASHVPLGNLMEQKSYEKCLKKVGITEKQLQESVDELSRSKDYAKYKDVLCLTKCVAEDLDILSPSGEIIMDKLKEHRISEGSDPKTDEFIKCLGKIAKISTCEDMVEVFKCIPKLD